jgi:hypothetical protein
MVDDSVTQQDAHGAGQSLLNWNFRVHDRSDNAIHVILVARQAVLPCGIAGMTSLADIFFHRAEIGREILWIAVLVALQIWPVFFRVMAGQTAARPYYRKMRLMNEICEASPFAFDRRRRKIDESSLPRDVVDAMAFRA